MELPLWCNGIGRVLGSLGTGWIPSPAQWVKKKDLVAQIQFLAGELPYAPGAALKKKEKKREGRGGKKIDVFQSLHTVCHHLFRFLLTLSAVIESFQYRGLLLHYSQIVSVFSWCEWNFFLIF